MVGIVKKDALTFSAPIGAPVHPLLMAHAQ